jgi:hypothetical protein
MSCVLHPLAELEQSASAALNRSLGLASAARERVQHCEQHLTGTLFGELVERLLGSRYRFLDRRCSVRKRRKQCPRCLCGLSAQARPASACERVIRALLPQGVVDAHVADLRDDAPRRRERPGVVELLQLAYRRLRLCESRSGLLARIPEHQDVELIHPRPQLDASLS